MHYPFFLSGQKLDCIPLKKCVQEANMGLDPASFSTHLVQLPSILQLRIPNSFCPNGSYDPKKVSLEKLVGIQPIAFLLSLCYSSKQDQIL